ncbi:MAG: hypothetical protein OXQ29_19910 [Rhodospirillaceae bacterium]|nr:hypothetical protein [Rhodospirillaceae bacterium]
MSENGDEPQAKPFLYVLVRGGPDNQDLNFKRIPGTDPVEFLAERLGRNPTAPINLWALMLDIDDPTPATALIFINAMGSYAVGAEKIMDEINKAQTYWREQIEPRFPDEEG